MGRVPVGDGDGDGDEGALLFAYVGGAQFHQGDGDDGEAKFD